MKRLFAALGSLFLCGTIWGATSVTYDGPITDSNAAIGISSAPRTYTMNMDDKNIDYVSVQVQASSTVFAAQTFNDGKASAGSFTVGTYTALSTAAATGQLTAVSTTVAAGTAGSATVVFGNNTAGALVTITGPPGGLSWTIGSIPTMGFVSSNTASSWATEVNKSSNTSGLTALQSGTSAIVTLTCTNAGAFCNSYAVTSSSPAEVSTAAFSGGADPVKVTIGGYVYRAVSDFAVGTSTAAMASNLTALIYASSPTTGVTASTVSTIGNTGIVYATSTATGSAGNYALASSNALAISTSGVFMTGGQDNAIACINGTCLTANKDWYPVTSAAQTATNLAAAFNASVASRTVTSAAAGAIVSATATIVGSGGNYAITTSTQNNLTISPYTSSSTVTGGAVGALSGATSSSYTINTSTLKIASHGFPTGLIVSISSTTGNQALYYSTAAAGTATTLAFGSTWYVISVDANDIQLSQTSTGAVAGVPVILVSSAVKTTADVWTINTSTPVGASSYQFYGGNNGTDFLPVSGSYSFANGSALTASSMTYVDFGNYDWKYLQMQVIPPATSGAIGIKTWIHGEKR